MAKGKLAWHVAELHEKYGPIVRTKPNELAMLDPEAWKDIYTVRPGGEYLEKYIPAYRPSGRLAGSIISAEKEEHSVLRKLLAPSFSDKAIRDQEPVVGRYVNLLLQRLAERCQDGTAAVNLRDWYNFTTFDVIGILAFGEDFGCLQEGKYHPWVAAIALAIREGGLVSALVKLQRRIDIGNNEPDIIGRLIDRKDDLNFSFETLRANAGGLAVAGSETTATLLTGITYLLLTHPDHLQKVTEEIRSTFQDTNDITLTSVNGLPYMLACLNEALRLYPPVPNGLPRVTPLGGTNIANTFVPGRTVVSVWALAMHRSKRHFKLPNEFHPERFLGSESFAGDRLDAVQPFSLGPRNCIGRSLAYAEMRLVLAKLLFTFDLTLAGDSNNWIERNRVYQLWFKPDLNVYLRPVTNSM
ncbi:hypothetical protein TruAng_001733 [Truncatella angustata]|nr:hypothetical protein TruAng_001733 [Truncatella angustata]